MGAATPMLTAGEGDWSIYRFEVDESALHIGVDQLHAESVADIHAFKSMLQPSFNGRIDYADPRSFVRRTGDNGIELLTDP